MRFVFYYRNFQIYNIHIYQVLYWTCWRTGPIIYVFSDISYRVEGVTYPWTHWPRDGRLHDPCYSNSTVFMAISRCIIGPGSFHFYCSIFNKPCWTIKTIKLPPVWLAKRAWRNINSVYRIIPWHNSVLVSSIWSRTCLDIPGITQNGIKKEYCLGYSMPALLIADFISPYHTIDCLYSLVVLKPSIADNWYPMFVRVEYVFLLPCLTWTDTLTKWSYWGLDGSHSDLRYLVDSASCQSGNGLHHQTKKWKSGPHG